MTRLSVIIPCLNVAGSLPSQLRALARERLNASYEVIIVDNGSTDHTRTVAFDFRGAFPAFKLIDEARPGRHHACNTGARAARGEFLVFVDGDDEVRPGFLRAMADALEKHTAAAGRLDHSRFHPQGSGYGQVQTTGLRSGLGFLPAASGGCLGVHRDVFLSLGGFREDPPYGEDIDLSWRLQLAGHEIVFEPKAVVAVRQRVDLRSMYRQHRNFGQAQAGLFRLYRHCGMPRRTLRSAMDEWWKILRGLLRVRSNDEKARLVRRLGRAVGRLRGSVRSRVFYP